MACPWGEAGSAEEIPAVIFLVVSRYEKNIQVCEKTYPGSTGVEGGDSMGGRGSEQVPDCRQGRSPAGGGGARRPESHRPRLGESRIPFKVSLRRFLHSDFENNKSSPSTRSKTVAASMGKSKPSRPAEQSREGRAGPGRGLPGGARRGRGSAGRARASSRRAAGRCGGLPLVALPSARLLSRSRLFLPLDLA